MSEAKSLITISLAGDNKDKTPDETHRALVLINEQNLSSVQASNRG